MKMKSCSHRNTTDTNQNSLLHIICHNICCSSWLRVLAHSYAPWQHGPVQLAELRAGTQNAKTFNSTWCMYLFTAFSVSFLFEFLKSTLPILTWRIKTFCSGKNPTNQQEKALQSHWCTRDGHFGFSPRVAPSRIVFCSNTLLLGSIRPTQCCSNEQICALKKSLTPLRNELTAL